MHFRLLELLAVHADHLIQQLQAIEHFIGLCGVYDLLPPKELRFLRHVQGVTLLWCVDAVERLDTLEQCLVHWDLC
jgi:hypothetical protein